MKYLVVSLLVMLLAGCSSPSTEEIVSDVKDGVVLITNDLSNNTGGMGSGFILENNKIVTNLHVVEGSGIIHVYSDYSKKKYKAIVVATDPVSDIAVLELEDWELFKKNENPVNLSLGNSDNSKLGDKVVVIGHPWDLQWSVSEGIISGKNRRIDKTPKFLDQVDAYIYKGNSGGPIFDESGNIICISNMVLAEEEGSYGFCIPSNLVKKVLYDLKLFGEVRWRVMNVSVGLSDDGYDVVVQDVEPNGAADKAGIKKGDRILNFYHDKSFGKGDVIKSPDDIISELAIIKGDDDSITLLLERDGKKLVVDVITNYKLSKDY